MGFLNLKILVTLLLLKTEHTFDPKKRTLVFSIETNILLLQDITGCLHQIDTSTFFIINCLREIDGSLVSMVNSFIHADDSIYRVMIAQSQADPIKLINLTMKNSPIDSLIRVNPRVKSKAPEPKKILFHSKVKSSGYAAQVKPRKMFQPITKSQKLKPKKSTLKVQEYNFSRPMGSLIGKNSDYLSTSPSCIVPTPTGKFLIAEDREIATFDGDSGKAVATEESTITSFDISTTGYLASGTQENVSLWSSKCPVKPIAKM